MTGQAQAGVETFVDPARAGDDTVAGTTGQGLGPEGERAPGATPKVTPSSASASSQGWRAR
jgi:hypothetical protein